MSRTVSFMDDLKINSSVAVQNGYQTVQKVQFYWEIRLKGLKLIKNYKTIKSIPNQKNLKKKIQKEEGET